MRSLFNRVVRSTMHHATHKRSASEILAELKRVRKSSATSTPGAGAAGASSESASLSALAKAKLQTGNATAPGRTSRGLDEAISRYSGAHGRYAPLIEPPDSSTDASGTSSAYSMARYQDYALGRPATNNIQWPSRTTTREPRVGLTSPVARMAADAEGPVREHARERKVTLPSSRAEEAQTAPFALASKGADQAVTFAESSAAAVLKAARAASIGDASNPSVRA